MIVGDDHNSGKEDIPQLLFCNDAYRITSKKSVGQLPPCDIETRAILYQQEGKKYAVQLWLPHCSKVRFDITSCCLGI